MAKGGNSSNKTVEELIAEAIAKEVALAVEEQSKNNGKGNNANQNTGTVTDSVSVEVPTLESVVTDTTKTNNGNGNTSNNGNGNTSNNGNGNTSNNGNGNTSNNGNGNTSNNGNGNTTDTTANSNANGPGNENAAQQIIDNANKALENQLNNNTALTDIINELLSDSDVSFEEEYFTFDQILAFIKRKRLEQVLLAKQDAEQREYFKSIMDAMMSEEIQNNEQSAAPAAAPAADEQQQSFDINTVLQNQEVQSYIQNQINEQVGALKSNNSRLTDQLTKMRGEKQSLDQILQSIQDEKELEYVKSGQMSVQELIDRRVNAARESWQPQLSEREQQVEELKQQLLDAQNSMRNFQLKNVVGTAALNNKFVNKTAVDDILALANNTFEIDANGNAVARDQNGNVMIGAKGQPMTADEWVQSLAESKPHYFQQLGGTGSTGNGANAGGQTVSLSDWQRMIATASDAEEKELLARKARGEFKIVY